MMNYQYITATLCKTLLDKIWILLTLAFMFFIVTPKIMNFRKLSSLVMKPVSFGNNLLEKRLDKFALGS